MPSRADRYDDELQKLAARYRAEGFDVMVTPGPSRLPAELASFRPDLVATSANRNVIVELRQRRISRDDDLEGLTATAARLGWQVDVVFLPPEPAGFWNVARRSEVLANVGALLRTSQSEAATLLLWSVVESALRERLATLPLVEIEKLRSTGSLVDEAVSVGLLTGPQRRAVLKLMRSRNGLSHGQNVDLMQPGELHDALLLVTWLASPDFATIDEIVEWFFSEYEDPAQWVPYVSAEGGYQYPPGEPHDARQVIADRYPDAPPDVIDEVASHIEPQGTEWVRKDSQFT